MQELARSVKAFLGKDLGPVVSDPTPGPAAGPVGPSPGPARRPRHLSRMAAALAAMLTVAIVAGWMLIPREKATPSVDAARRPIAGPDARSDEDLVQGSRKGVDLAVAAGPRRRRRASTPRSRPPATSGRSGGGI